MADTRDLAVRFMSTLEARDWAGFAAVLHPDVVYALPQSRERIRGRDRYVQFNVEYPGDWHLAPRLFVADAHAASVWFDWTLDGERGDGVVFLEVVDGLVVRVTDFWPEPYEPPPGRDHLVERD